MSGSRRDRRDSWLFLPPELEREGPALLALLDDPAAPERTLPCVQREVEELVLAGTPERWSTYLRARGEQVARRAGRRSCRRRCAALHCG